MKSFAELKPTISTLVAFFGGTLDYNSIFFLIDTSSFDVNVTKRGKASLCKTGTSGTIASLRMEFEGKKYFRGFLPSKNPFKNVLSMDVYTSEKLVNVKLSKSKIKMCGVREMKSGYEVVDIVLGKIETACKTLSILRNNRDGAVAYLEKIKNQSKGEHISRKTPKPPRSKAEDPIPIVDDNKIVIKYGSTKSQYQKEIRRMIESSSFVYYSDLSNYIEGLIKVIENHKPISELDLSKQISIKTAMINYNYHVGRKVKRSELIEKFGDRVGWNVVYNPDSVIATKVEMPYTPDETTGTERKKKIPCHVFLVYSSGSITQSGPGGPLVGKAYDEFIKVLMG